MNPVQIVAGVVAGAVGAAIWAAIAYYANVQVGYVAWGIGGLVGIAVASTGKHSMVAGVGAVLITIVALLGGKYASIELAIQSGLSEQPSTPDTVTDEVATAWLADGVVKEREAAGQAVTWPPGMTFVEAENREDYPTDIWNEASARLEAMSEEDKQSYLQAQLDLQSEFRETLVNEIRKTGFLSTFGVLDLVFFGLAIVTAWGLANGSHTESS